MNSLINRQAIINSFRYDDDGSAWDMDDIVYRLEQFPSAETEIVRCKDCKHIRKWRSEESAKKFGQEYECARGVFKCPKPEDFCSHAERRIDNANVDA